MKHVKCNVLSMCVSICTYLPVLMMTRSLSSPQVLQEGLGLFALTVASKQKPQSMLFTILFHLEAQNHLLWNLPATPANITKKPCSSFTWLDSCHYRFPPPGGTTFITQSGLGQSVISHRASGIYVTPAWLLIVFHFVFIASSTNASVCTC